ncbi:MAG: hypothetical protein HUJ95_01980, partial [Bacteroidales bacterium]|nr:hypothetical protein [Bacteroidales bacterium]
MIKRTVSAIVATFLGLAALNATIPYRLVIPDVQGYVTLKGDFHVHTVFSDADVWPTERVQEAYLEGLDFISMTDHLDSRIQHAKHKLDNILTTDQDDSWRIASSVAAKYNVMVFHSAEITRGMPPGHFNTHFINSAKELCEIAESADNKKGTAHQAVMMKGLKAAKEQGSFNVWNHPAWEAQAPNKTIWYDEHSEILKAGLMDGIEIFNGYGENSQNGYSPEAHHWAVENNLTIVSGTDAHHPLALYTDYTRGEHRPVTLVFAKERSEEAVKEALIAHRTAVFGNGYVYGSEEVLKPLLEACLEITITSITDKKLVLKVINKSSIPVTLSKVEGESQNLSYQRELTIKPFDETVLTFS